MLLALEQFHMRVVIIYMDMCFISISRFFICWEYGECLVIYAFIPSRYLINDDFSLMTAICDLLESLSFISTGSCDRSQIIQVGTGREQ